MLLVVILLFLLYTQAFSEKLYVVERERGSIAIIEDGKIKGKVEDLGNLNHATVKFKDGYAYVISRDGWLSKIDLKEDRLLKKAKVGESSIGFDFSNGYIAVANYSPKNVVFLDENLEIKKVLETDSRNVGVKGFSGLFVFSLMDKDQIWVVSSKGDKVKVLENVGSMPFDALLYKDKYVVGFFNEKGVGLLSLKEFSYGRIPFKANQDEIVFKIPHFGLWGIRGNLAYIPAVGERKVYVLDLESFEIKKHFDLEGLPVFAVVSPDGRYLAVNYSGDKEDFVSIIDLEKSALIKSLPVGKRVMHLRFSMDSGALYLSSYFESKVKALKVPQLDLLWEISVPYPSGVFLVR